jgi:hypothetical protein
MKAFKGEEYADKWQEEFNKKETKGFMVLMLWRPIKPM